MGANCGDPALMLTPELMSLVLKGLPTHDSVQCRLREVACLSRGWAIAIAEFVNDVGCGISPAILRSIKRASHRLDLEFLREDFKESADHLLAKIDMTEYIDEDDLDELGHAKLGRALICMAIGFMNEFGAADVASAVDLMFDAVAGAYKKFLVVKAVETKLKDQALPGGAGLNIWSEKCMVTKIVECAPGILNALPVHARVTHNARDEGRWCLPAGVRAPGEPLPLAYQWQQHCGTLEERPIERAMWAQALWACT